MSVKKNQKTRQSEVEQPVDPAAVVLLSRQIRDLLRFHQCMGITTYPAVTGLRNFLQKKHNQSDLQRGMKRSRAQVPTPGKAASPSLEAVNREIIDCRRCGLAGQRSGQVPGQGSERPKLLVVGDWSEQESFSREILFGREEDAMLHRMMEAIGLAADDVHVTNAIKCCPLDVPPDITCARKCFSHLSREIAALKPRLILTMGEMAVSQLLATSAPLVRLRGRFHAYRYPDSSPSKVMPTFHPRFLLANPEMKKMVWMDLQMVQRQL